MKKILLIFLTFSFTINAQVPDEVHEKCKDVADYVGCVQIFTGSVITKKEKGIPEVKELKKALGLLPSRLENTSLRDFSIAIQPFTDALASAKLASDNEDYSVDERIEILALTNAAIRLEFLIQLFRDVWSKGIDKDVLFGDRINKFVGCSEYDYYIDAFNKFFESNVINYWEINLRAFNSDCYLTEGGRKPIYRKYEGEMLYWIKEAIKEINKNGDFPTYPYPYKTLQQLKDAYIEELQIETKSSINKYKEVFISEKNTWIITNSLNDFSKQDFRRDRNAMFKIQGTRAINANAIVAIGYVGDHGPKLRQINSWKEYLLKFYNYDFEVAKKKGNNVPVEKILFLLPSSLALANELVITNYGDKKSNQKDARDILISMLSVSIEDCVTCFENDKPTPAYSTFIFYRDEAKKLIKEIAL